MSVGALRRALARVAVVGLLASGAGTVAVAELPSAAFAESSYQMESEFIQKMNSAREANGLRPYSVAGDLTSIARSHSRQMASKQRLYHNPNLTTEVQNWQAVGENVGEGPTVSDIHNAFMNSPEHRANILDHDFTQVGVGVAVDNNGTIWVTEDFREPMHSSSSSSSTSSPTRHVTHHSSSPTQRAGASRTGGRPAAHTPAPAASSRAQLLARLTSARTAAAKAPATDPVAQALTYVSTLDKIAG